MNIITSIEDYNTTLWPEASILKAPRSKTPGWLEMDERSDLAHDLI
jgi:hypothetical protein